MSKQEQIEELKKKLVEAHANNEQWRSEARRLENEKHAKVALDKLIKRNREATENLDLLKLGYVKVETLRGMILQDYDVGYNGSLSTAEMRLRLRSNDRVEAALLAALTERKPKFATGGYTGNGSGPVGSVHPGYFIPGGRYTADDVRRWAKKSTEASFKLVWDRNL